MGKALGGRGGCLAIIFAESNHLDPSVLLVHVLRDVEGAIPAAVIHEDHLILFLSRLAGVFNGLQEWRNTFCFIVDEDHDGQGRSMVHGVRYSILMF